MASTFKPLMIALQNKIIADIPDSPDIPGIREANHDIGQIDIEGVRPAVAFPWLGLDFLESNYEQKQLKKQWNKFKLSCRLAFDPFSLSSSLASEEVRNKGFAYFDIEDKLFVCLQDFRYEYEPGLFMLITGLRRVSAITENRKDTLRVRRVIFVGMFEETLPT